MTLSTLVGPDPWSGPYCPYAPRPRPGLPPSRPGLGSRASTDARHRVNLRAPAFSGGGRVHRPSPRQPAPPTELPLTSSLAPRGSCGSGGAAPARTSLFPRVPRPQPMFQTYRNDFRGAATLALGPARAREARWTSGAIPTLENALSLLPDLLRPVCPYWDLALRDDSAATPLDAAEGHYEPVIADIARATPTTVLAMSHAFTTVIAPLRTAPATRVKAARYWRSCLTWALARGALPQLLPMPHDVLLAMLWDFTAMGASKPTLKAVVDAVVARHRAGRLRPHGVLPPRPVLGPPPRPATPAQDGCHS